MRVAATTVAVALLAVAGAAPSVVAPTPVRAALAVLSAPVARAALRSDIRTRRRIFRLQYAVHRSFGKMP